MKPRRPDISQYQDTPTAKQEKPPTTSKKVPKTATTEKPKKKYGIDPDTIPRPTHLNNTYFNGSKDSVFDTVVGKNPPMANCHYIARETHNSSCRFVRSTAATLPLYQSNIRDSNLPLGLVFQPFCEQQEEETPIPLSDCTLLNRL